MIEAARPVPTVLTTVLERFSQGDLIVEPLTTFVATSQGAASTLAQRLMPPIADGSVAITVPDSDAFPFFVILDQGCDIEKSSMPFIHGSPVYNATRFFSSGDVRRIAGRAGFQYLYPLSAAGLENFLSPERRDSQENPSAKSEWLWVADLRLQVPMDKWILVGRQPISGFVTAAERLIFGEDLALRRSRPAVPSVVLDRLQPRLPRDARAQFRVTFDDAVFPSSVGVIALSDDDAASGDLEPILLEIVEDLNCEEEVVFTVRMSSMSALPATDYVASVPLAIDD